MSDFRNLSEICHDRPVYYASGSNPGGILLPVRFHYQHDELKTATNQSYRSRPRTGIHPPPLTPFLKSPPGWTDFPDTLSAGQNTIGGIKESEMPPPRSAGAIRRKRRTGVAGDSARRLRYFRQNAKSGSTSFSQVTTL
jgi:hypothetical protein